jgi:hypothetical protein
MRLPSTSARIEAEKRGRQTPERNNDMYDKNNAIKIDTNNISRKTHRHLATVDDGFVAWTKCKGNNILDTQN